MAPSIMKAAVCKEVGAPILIEDVPVPSPDGRQVLVRIKAASLCQSDISIIGGEIPGVFPLIPGHEAISVVEKLGPDAAAFGIGVGDLVGAPGFDGMCMKCKSCVHYGPQFCPRMGALGVSKPGYFAEYTLIDAASIVVIEKACEGDSRKNQAPQLSPLFCAGITVWDAIERAQPTVNDTVAIIGAGGLGAIAVRYLNAMGIKVIALDVREEQLQALEGVDGTINTKGLTDEELLEKVLELNNGLAVDTAIVTSGAVPAYLSAPPILKPEGKLIVVGLPHKPIPWSALTITSQALKILGSRLPGRACTERCLKFTLRKEVFPKVNPRKFKLEDINEMINLMKANKVEEGRMVIRFF